MPWSLTQKDSVVPSTRAPSSHGVWSGEYLSALSSRLEITRPRRSRSVNSTGIPSGTDIWMRSAEAPRPSTISRHRSGNETRPTAGESVLFSSRETVRRFSTSRSRRSPWRSIAWRNSSRVATSSANSGRRSVFTNPMIAVSGVRSSWDTTATKSLFILFSSRSSATDSCSCASKCSSRVACSARVWFCSANRSVRARLWKYICRAKASAARNTATAHCCSGRTGTMTAADSPRPRCSSRNCAGAAPCIRVRISR